jgi:hypothetical protein
MIASTPGPNWAEILLAVSTSVIAAGLLIGAIQLRESRSSRYALIALEFAKLWDSPEFIRSRNLIMHYNVDTARDLADLYIQLEAERPRSPAFNDCQRVPNFFEYVSAFERYGWVDIDWIEKTFGFAVFAIWERWEAAAKKERDLFHGEAFTGLEDLVRRLKVRNATYEPPSLFGKP